MEAEMMAVLAMTVAFFGFCLWLQLHSRWEEKIQLEHLKSGDSSMKPGEQSVRRMRADPVAEGKSS